jgi:hypothetical protein
MRTRVLLASTIHHPARQISKDGARRQGPPGGGRGRRRRLDPPGGWYYGGGARYGAGRYVGTGGGRGGEGFCLEV